METALDVEWAHAIAPGANIVLVEANNDSDSNLFAAVNYARQQAGVSVISMSWGSDDNAAYASNDQALAAEYLVTPSGHQGITFVAASGDTGVPEFPSTSPNVLAVGGTDLYLNSSGAITSETAWTPETEGGVTYSGGGGVSQEFSGRKVPDVSYNAGEGYDVYDSFTGGGGWISVGGTSAGSPQWAALVAIADQGRVLNGQGTLNGATQTISDLYAAPSSDFTDITSGSTQFESAASATIWRPVWAAPKANLLIPYLAGTGSGTTTTTTTAPSAPASISATATSSSSVTVSWSASSGATGYDLYELENGQAVLVSSDSASTTSASISGLSASTTYSFEVSAYNSAGSNATGWTQVTTLGGPCRRRRAAEFPRGCHQQHDRCALVAGGQRGHRLSGVRLEWQLRRADRQRDGRDHFAECERIDGRLDAVFLCDCIQRNVECLDRLGERRDAGGRDPPPSPRPWSPRLRLPPPLENSLGQLRRATGYRDFLSEQGQAVPLGSVGWSTTSVNITGMSPGTTYEFVVLAYNRTSQAASAWTALTTNSSSAATKARAAFDLTDGSSPLLNVGVTFNAAAANSSVGGGLAMSTAAATSNFTAAGVFNQQVGGTSSFGARNVAAAQN